MEAFGRDNCNYEVFPEGNSDFSSYVANAKTWGADVFFSPTSTEAAALIIDQANTQALGIPLLAGDTWDANVVLNAAIASAIPPMSKNAIRPLANGSSSPSKAPNDFRRLIAHDSRHRPLLKRPVFLGAPDMGAGSESEGASLVEKGSMNVCSFEKIFIFRDLSRICY
jgi:hypothetical protein